MGGGSSSAPAASSHDRLVFDCLSAVLLMLVAILGAYMPKYLASRGSLQQGTASSLAFHLGNMLSGGVMLSAGFCHLLADALRQLAFIGRFPIAPFLAAVGYLTTLLADQLVQGLTTDADAAQHGGASSSRSHAAGPADGGSGGLFGGGGGLQQLRPGSRQQAWGYSRLLEKHGSGAGADGQGGSGDFGRHVAGGAGNGTSCAVELMPAAAAAAGGGGGGRPACCNGQQQQQHGGFVRRPGSAGGLAARAGSGVGIVARTRSLTGPAPLPSPLALASSPAAAGAAAGSTPPSAAQPAAAAAPAACEDGCVLTAAGSPRAVSAAGLRPRSPVCGAKCLAAQARAQQQQPQGWDAAEERAAADPQQQQQPGCNGAAAPGRPPPIAVPGSSNSAAAGPLDGAAQQQQQHCCYCGAAAATPAGGGGAQCSMHRAGSAQPDMTEACTVARVAGHLELEVMSTTSAGGHNHAHFQVFLSQRPLSFATSLLLACALCIHSILEGLALGAQQSMQATEDIMLAIAAHKGLAAYALGASIVESQASDSKFWLVVSLFAFATPLGIGIGYASSVLGHGPVSAAMSALASGTFLYVALNEVIPKELEHPDGHRLAKVAALLLGFGLMSLLAVWA